MKKEKDSIGLQMASWAIIFIILLGLINITLDSPLWFFIPSTIIIALYMMFVNYAGIGESLFIGLGVSALIFIIGGFILSL